MAGRPKTRARNARTQSDGLLDLFAEGRGKRTRRGTYPGTRGKSRYPRLVFSPAGPPWQNEHPASMRYQVAWDVQEGPGESRAAGIAFGSTAYAARQSAYQQMREKMGGAVAGKWIRVAEDAKGRASSR